MQENFTHTILGRTGIPVFRLGLSATFLPGKKTVYKAIDLGLNYFFCYGIDLQMTGVLREVFRTRRRDLVVATGAYNFVYFHTDLRRSLEKRLRQLKTDYLDVFLFLGVTKEADFPPKLREEMCRLRDEGKVRAVGMSTHDRKFAGKMASEGALDVLMVRYNAAHHGAEQDIFPCLQPHNPGIVSFTATRWSYLIRRSRKWPPEEPIPTPGQCYRFVLSHPSVHICMTAPTNIRQLEENFAALQQGPLSPEEMEFIRKYGDLVHHTKKWFM